MNIPREQSSSNDQRDTCTMTLSLRWDNSELLAPHSLPIFLQWFQLVKTAFIDHKHHSPVYRVTKRMFGGLGMLSVFYTSQYSELTELVSTHPCQKSSCASTVTVESRNNQVGYPTHPPAAPPKVFGYFWVSICAFRALEIPSMWPFYWEPVLSGGSFLGKVPFKF